MGWELGYPRFCFPYVKLSVFFFSSSDLFETKVKRELKFRCVIICKFNNKKHTSSGHVDLASKDESTSL